MKVMVMVKATKDSEAGVMPSEQLLTEMGKFNEELVKAGVILAGVTHDMPTKCAPRARGGDPLTATTVAAMAPCSPRTRG